MSSTRVLLVSASAVLVAGVVLVVTELQDDTMTGWFAYAPLSEDPWQGPTVLTPAMVVGGTLVWIASLVVCGVLVHRGASRRPLS